MASQNPKVRPLTKPPPNDAEHLIGPPVPLEITGGRKGYPLPSSWFMVPGGHARGRDDTVIELDDSLDEEITQLTNALGGVGI